MTLSVSPDTRTAAADLSARVRDVCVWVVVILWALLVVGTMIGVNWLTAVWLSQGAA